MVIKDIFYGLVSDKNTEPLFELIQQIHGSIPQSQRTGKGVVWSLRQIRKQVVQEKVPLDVKNQSLDVLIKSDETDWHSSHSGIDQEIFHSYNVRGI